MRHGAIAPALPHEEYVFNVILNNGTRLVGLAVEPCTIAGSFRGPIGNLVPEDGRQAVQAVFSCARLNIRVQGHSKMPADPFAWHTHVSDNAADAPARNQHAAAFRPDAIQFSEKLLVVLQVRK